MRVQLGAPEPLSGKHLVDDSACGGVALATGPRAGLLPIHPVGSAAFLQLIAGPGNSSGHGIAQARLCRAPRLVLERGTSGRGAAPGAGVTAGKKCVAFNGSATRQHPVISCSFYLTCPPSFAPVQSARHFWFTMHGHAGKSNAPLVMKPCLFTLTDSARVHRRILLTPFFAKLNRGRRWLQLTPEFNA